MKYVPMMMVRWYGNTMIIVCAPGSLELVLTPKNQMIERRREGKKRKRGFLL